MSGIDLYMKIWIGLATHKKLVMAVEDKDIYN